jgi:hypothetical protein
LVICNSMHQRRKPPALAASKLQNYPITKLQNL